MPEAAVLEVDEPAVGTFGVDQEVVRPAVTIAERLEAGWLVDLGEGRGKVVSCCGWDSGESCQLLQDRAGRLGAEHQSSGIVPRTCLRSVGGRRVELADRRREGLG